MSKYEVFGFHASPNAIDFLSGIGVDRIQARYFYLTSRWMSRVLRIPAMTDTAAPLEDLPRRSKS